MAGLVAVSGADGVLELTLSRPDDLNAFTAELLDELAGALDAARRPEVRAVIITGAGRAFSAGQDLAEVQASDMPVGERLRQHYNPSIRAIRSLDKPVIAAVNGVAAGAGVALALACDIRIASEKARFVPAFVAIGLVPDSGMSWTATRLVGEARAFEWFVSNRPLGADEALAWGLVNEVVAVDAFMDRVRERARELAAAPGDAVGMTKRLLRTSHGALDEQLDYEVALQQAASEHPAYVERIGHFLAGQR